MSERIKISESEWKIMHVLWSKSPLTVSEISETLEESTTWKPRTIKTLLSRLIDKNAVMVENQGRSNFYSPIVQREVCIEQESKSFLDRVYSGVTQKLLANFIENESLSDDEIDALQKMLEDHKNKKMQAD